MRVRQMKTFVQSLIITVALIILFSTGHPTENAFKPPGSVGTQYPGNSGVVIPGNGADVVKLAIQQETNKMEVRKSSESADGVKNETQAENETQPEIEMEVQNKMGDMMLAFWHGVASVLIGEAAAIVVAVVYKRIFKNSVQNVP